MKKPALPLKFWIALHSGLVLALILSLFLNREPLSVNTNLVDLLPPSSSAYNMAEADRLFNQKHNRDFVILARDADFALARENAERLYRELEKSGTQFDELSLFFDESIIFDYAAFLHEYRYALLDPQSAVMLETGDAQIVADEALARAYGAFSFSGLDYLDTDPFLLVERELRFFFGIVAFYQRSRASR
jgi:predicted exporter